MAGSKANETITRRAEEGDWGWMVEPLDYKIIEALPDQDMMVGGLYQLGKTVRDLRATTFKEADLGPDIFGGRLRTMEAGTLVRRVQMVGGRGVTAWQKTTKGKEVLEQWRKQQP